MGKYTYLTQFSKHTATTMLPVNILLQYKKCSEKVFIYSIKNVLKKYSFQLLFFFKLLGNLLYNFMPLFKTLF